MKVCKWCGSEFVCWNWFKSPFWRTYLRNFYRGWKRPWRYLDRWSHECWNCSNMISTFFKVRDGILHNDLEKKFDALSDLVRKTLKTESEILTENKKEINFLSIQ